MSGNTFFFSKHKREENKEYEVELGYVNFNKKYIFSMGTHLCVWSCVQINACVQVCIACLCECVGACASICVCLCVCAGRLKHHCAAATTGPPSPPTRHNKEQLNAAALPAEEPTASHTSTNRQICLKPKGRSNKSQPTESNPLRSPSSDSNQKVTGWLHPITHYHRSGHISITCAVLHAKLEMAVQ